jgi:hypothetical protein
LVILQEHLVWADSKAGARDVTYSVEPRATKNYDGNYVTTSFK